jgi:hypoxanthine-guanine phosphoribosyltransferase
VPRLERHGEPRLGLLGACEARLRVQPSALVWVIRLERDGERRGRECPAAARRDRQHVGDVLKGGFALTTRFIRNLHQAIPIDFCRPFEWHEGDDQQRVAWAGTRLHAADLDAVVLHREFTPLSEG